jgi:hypothetical protein
MIPIGYELYRRKIKRNPNMPHSLGITPIHTSQRAKYLPPTKDREERRAY